MTTIIIIILSSLIFAKGQLNLNDRLIGNIRPDSEPRNAALFFNTNGGNICSGALIHPLYVLTTATCAVKAFEEERRVLIGGNVALDFNKASHINNVMLHPEFNSWSLENDIALVQLVDPTEQYNRILRISKNWIQNGLKAIALGYGDNEAEAGNGSLRQVKVSIVDNFSVCGKYVEFMDYKKMCSYQSRACEGDQGGPLILEGTNQLIGLISITNDQASMCGGQVVSPVTTYVRVSEYIQWIREITHLWI